MALSASEWAALAAGRPAVAAGIGAPEALRTRGYLSKEETAGVRGEAATSALAAGASGAAIGAQIGGTVGTAALPIAGTAAGAALGAGIGFLAGAIGGGAAKTASARKSAVESKKLAQKEERASRKATAAATTQALRQQRAGQGVEPSQRILAQNMGTENTLGPSGALDEWHKQVYG